MGSIKPRGMAMAKSALNQARKVVLQTLKAQGYPIGRFSRDEITEMAKEYAKDVRNNRSQPRAMVSK